VTFCGALVVLMTWFEKVSFVGDNVTVEAAKEKSGELSRIQAKDRTARFTSASEKLVVRRLRIGLGDSRRGQTVILIRWLYTGVSGRPTETGKYRDIWVEVTV